MWRRAVALASAYFCWFYAWKYELRHPRNQSPPALTGSSQHRPLQPDGREREGGYEIYFDGLFPVVFTSQPINGGSSAAIPTISSSPMIRSRSGIPYTLSYRA